MTAGDWKPTVVVELSEDGDGWFAECKELDYQASGQTVEEVKNNFQDGLHMTILLHRKIKQPHAFQICRDYKYVMPNFDWKFIEGQPVPELGTVR